MTTERAILNAGVQYNDFKGEAAADEHTATNTPIYDCPTGHRVIGWQIGILCRNMFKTSLSK